MQHRLPISGMSDVFGILLGINGVLLVGCFDLSIIITSKVCCSLQKLTFVVMEVAVSDEIKMQETFCKSIL